MDYDSLRIKNVLVPVDGSRAGFDALALACYLSKRNKGTVYAVYVIEVARNLPLDAEMSNEATSGEDVLTEAEFLQREAQRKAEAEFDSAEFATDALRCDPKRGGLGNTPDTCANGVSTVSAEWEDGFRILSTRPSLEG